MARIPFVRSFGKPIPHVRDRMDDEPPLPRMRPMQPIPEPFDPDHVQPPLDVEDQIAQTDPGHEAFAAARQALADGAVEVSTPVFETKGKT